MTPEQCANQPPRGNGRCGLGCALNRTERLAQQYAVAISICRELGILQASQSAEELLDRGTANSSAPQGFTPA
jgi:hypothetical protein